MDDQQLILPQSWLKSVALLRVHPFLDPPLAVESSKKTNNPGTWFPYSSNYLAS